MRDVLISVSPNPSTNVKKAQLEKHLFDRRQAQLDSDTERVDPNSKLGQLFAKIADNFILTVENVHFRFEDTLSRQPSWGIETHPERCFSLGVTLDHFELRGVVLGPGGEWEPRCAKEQQRFLNKTAVIGAATSRTAEQRGEHALRLTHPYGLGIYVQHGERPLRSDDISKWKADMRGYIAAADDPTENDWILGPIAAACKISVDTAAAKRKPSSSRIWSTQQLPAVARAAWVQHELTKTNVVVVAVQMTEQHDLLRLCWAFETEKDATVFEALHFAGESLADSAGAACRPLQAAAVVDCQYERARGETVSERGVVLLRWTNAGSKRRASSVRYTLWMESSGEGEAEPLRCSTMTGAQLAEFLESTAVPKPTVSKNSTKDAANTQVDDHRRKGEKRDGAHTELEVRTRHVNVNLHHRTLLDLIAMQNWYSNVERWRQASALRPTCDDGKAMSVLQAPRAWWQFAINAVIGFLPSHIFKTKLRMYIDGALEYDGLFKRKYSNAEYAAGRGDGRPWYQPLREHEHARLDELEEFLPLQMVLKRREAMWQELREEGKHDEVRRRDVIEAEVSLLGVAAQEWTARPEGDCVLASNWAHFEGARGKLKRQWLVLAEVRSEQPTRFSGWLEMRELLPDGALPTSGVRLWFRLKGAALSWYTDTDEKTKPAGMIGISVVEEVRQVPDSADTFELVVGSSGRRIRLTCETFKELKQWLASIDGALKHVPVREEGDRWLLVYNKLSDSKATEVLPLKQWSYTLEAPRKAKKGMQHSYELSIGLVNSSVRKCVLGCTTEDEADFLGLMAHIKPEAAGSILGNSSVRAVKRTGIDIATGGADADAELEDDDEDDDSVLAPRSPLGKSPASLDGAEDDGRSSLISLQKIVVHVERVSVSCGVRDTSWLSVDFRQLELSTTTWSQSGVPTTTLTASVQDIQVEDLYTRDSSHPQLICRLADDVHGCNDDPMLRFLFKTTYSQPEPIQPPAASADCTDETPSSATTVGSVDKLKLSISEDSEGQLETYVQAVMQPTQLVLNAHILPVMASFLALREYEGFSKISKQLSASVTRLFARFEQMTLPSVDATVDGAGNGAADGEPKPLVNTVLTNTRVLLKLEGFELVLADDLSTMRDDASAVVLRMESFRVAHTDYHSPRSALGAKRHVDAEAGWSQRIDASEMDGIIPLEGHASKIEVFCCHRDDYSRNRQVILQPVTANISLHISAKTGRVQEWLNLHVAVDTLDVHFSTKALVVLVKVLLSSSRLEGHYVSRALKLAAKAQETTVGGTNDAAHSAAAAHAGVASSVGDGANAEAAASLLVTTSESAASALVRAKLDVQKMRLTVEAGGANSSDGSSVPLNHLQVEIVDLMMRMVITDSEVVMRYQILRLNAFRSSGTNQQAEGEGRICTADVPFGVCHIVRTLSPGDEAAEAQADGADFAGLSHGESRWLYNTADPNRLVCFTTLKDLLRVASPVKGPQEITQLLPLLTVAARMATLKAGLAALAGGAVPASALASTLWGGIGELQQLLQGRPCADETRQSGSLSHLLGSDLAEAGINVAKELLGEQLWQSLVPTLRHIADFADTATATEQRSRLGREVAAAVGAGGTVTTSRSNNSMTIQFGAPAQAGAASTQSTTAEAVEAADFSALGAAELELLCVSLGAASGGERTKDELLVLLKEQLLEGRMRR